MNKILKKNSKQAQQFLREYNSSYISSVFEAYGRPSYAKIMAENHIKEIMKELYGDNYKIISFNTCNFTCCFTFEEDGKTYYRVDTSKHTYLIED